MSGGKFPPSFSDCRVKDEYKEKIEEIARCFYHGTADRLDKLDKKDIDHYARIDPAEMPCHVMAEDMGMQLIDSGWARMGYTVVPDPQPSEPNPDGPTAFEQCVFKFSKWGLQGSKDGQEQTREEIENFKDLPDDMKHPVGDEAPIFNPIQDYDEDESLWLTQPYCPPPGDTKEVKRRIRRKGWEADDMHTDNVGEYPTLGDSAAIDYGLDVTKRGPRIGGDLDSLAQRLRDVGAKEVDKRLMRFGGAEVTFTPDKDLPGQLRPTTDSEMRIHQESGIERIDVYFPMFRDTVMDRGEMADEMEYGMDYTPVHSGVDVQEHVSIARDKVGANFLLGASAGDRLTPEEAVREYEALVASYDSHFAEFVTTGQPTDVTDTTDEGVENIRTASDFVDVDEQWKNALEGIGMRGPKRVTNQPGNRGPDMNFIAPNDMYPAPPSKESVIYWDTPASVEKIVFAAARDTLNARQRENTRDIMSEIAMGVDNRFSDINAIGELEYIDSDPMAAGDIYSLKYEVGLRRVRLDPQKAIDILDFLVNSHNRRFQ